MSEPFDSWWSSTNNQNWFSARSVDGDTLRQVASESFTAGVAHGDTLLDQMARAVVEDIATGHRIHFIFDMEMGCYSSATCECGQAFDTENACAEWSEHIRSLLTDEKLTQLKLTVREGQ